MKGNGMNTNVVGGVSKPAPEQLVEIYEKFDDGQSKEIRRQLREGTLTNAHIQALIDHKNPFDAEKLPQKKRGSDNAEIFAWLDDWKKFCGEFKLKIELDFDAIKEKVLDRPKGFDWVIYMPSGITSRDAIDKLCKPQFKVWEEIPVEQYSLERQPDKPYVILCRANVEPDDVWRGKSADDMSETAIPFLDCRERYMLEAFYYWKKGKHLDITGWTRCPRSRASNGDVACAYWGGARGGFYADWDYPDDRRSRAGGREAVILVP